MMRFRPRTVLASSLVALVACGGGGGGGRSGGSAVDHAHQLLVQRKFDEAVPILERYTRDRLALPR